MVAVVAVKVCRRSLVPVVLEQVAAQLAAAAVVLQMAVQAAAQGVVSVAVRGAAEAAARVAARNMVVVAHNNRQGLAWFLCTKTMPRVR